MRYNYFNPFSKQYYFPEGFQQHSLFTSFYQPYTFAGSLLWLAWHNFGLIRRFCREESVESVLPIDCFKKHLPLGAIMAINRGTEGIEQKMSILAYDPVSSDEFFMKYAESEIAQKNVANEGKVLAQLKHLDFVPKLLQLAQETDYTLIQTNISKGKRLRKQKVEAQILNILILLSKQKVNTDRMFSSELKSCFAHGDFCPWNMMLDGSQLNVFDWEMAGIYPLGYDLFTFIFQTSFLLSPTVKIKDILKRNRAMITSYFSFQGINDWENYFMEFIDIKLKIESAKKDNRLLTSYSELKRFIIK
jgi:hypothetical protein